MALSRLENLIKNVEGNLLYVNPNDIDATDSITNQGNSLTRPFKTIQRALIEAARFSYLSGGNNDKFDKTTIILYPGEHLIDNRPGYSVYDSSGTAIYKDVNGNTIGSYIPTGILESSNLDLNNSSNILYTFNSVDGGVIIPRGTSLVGLDLRKTKIRPLFVPDPEDSNIERSAIFKITGACYLSTFSVFDADPTGFCYKDYTTTKNSTGFSHHKLTTFEYADGVNPVVGVGNSDTTDLQMYYYKVAQAYGVPSGRSIPDFPASTDFEPKVDEYRIVGEVTSTDLGITSIRSGNGVTGTTSITVKTNVDHNLSVDTPIRVIGISTNSDIYNGSFVVTSVSDTNTKEFTYTASSIPSNVLPNVSFLANSKVIVESDTVSSASPYIFNVTMRSVYGMNGLHADGNKATGFKSIVLAQYTGVGLQKDDNAFLKYNNGIYQDQTTLGSSVSLHIDPEAVHKPEYRNFHIKSSNKAYIQNVSIFAIGFANHFISESGGDQSITNSNSNFGANSLKSVGFRNEAFSRDDVGYITHIIPPKESSPSEQNIPWLSLDTTKIINAGVGYTDKLYIQGYTDEDILPPHNIDSYKIGGRKDDQLYLNVTISGIVSSFSAPIYMQGSTSTSREKSFNVYRNSGINEVLSNETVVLTQAHNFTSGEKIIVVAENGDIPDGLTNESIYYAITTGVSTHIKLAENFNNATAATPVPINDIQQNGGKLRIVSRVVDKIPGELGHPIQFDSTNSQWYLQSSSTNNIRTSMISLGINVFSEQSPVSYFKRKSDDRSITDRIYRVRYVIPKELEDAKPPSDGFVLQESSTVSINSGDESSTITDPTVLRNPKIIADASWTSGIASVRTEKPHEFLVGDVVKVSKVTSGVNTTGENDIGFNGIYTITTVSDSKTFKYSLTDNPGSFTNVLTTRDDTLPVVSRNEYKDVFSIFRREVIQEHSADKRDGIYHLTLIKNSVEASDSNFSGEKYSQPVRNLYPQQDRDNYNSDPNQSISFALRYPTGRVVLNDSRNSITKESVLDLLESTSVAIGITNITSVGTAATVFTTNSHGLNPVFSLTKVGGGSGYSADTRNVRLVSTGIGTGSGLTINILTVSGGAISTWEIVDNGSGYVVGETLTTSGSVGTGATFTVAAIRNDVNKAVQVVGVTTTGFGGESNSYNGLFRITSIKGPKEFSFSISDDGGTYSSGGLAYIVDNAIGITSFVYNSTTGIATVSTGSTSHGLFVNNGFSIIGTSQTQFNGTYLVESRVGVSTFTVNLGSGLSLPSYSGPAYIVKNSISVNGEDTNNSNENISRRLISLYDKTSVQLTADISSTASSVGVSTNNLINKGDFLQIDDEIVRVADQPTSTTVSILRSVLGTRPSSHVSGSEVRKIKVIPSEFRRPSFIRASNHAFEYMGFGPGNYPTALPQRQSKVLTIQDQLLAQRNAESGGIVVYTGMNESGDFYIGNRRLSSNTAQEETLEAPIFDYYGTSTLERKLSAIFDDVTIRERIRVDGGTGNLIRSEFSGPVSFSNKVTSTNKIESNSFLVKGESDNPSEITVGIATPTSTGQSGDIVLRDVPTTGTSSGSYLGWVWTDSWKRFGAISTDRDSFTLLVDKIGIGLTDPDRAIKTIGSVQFGPTVCGSLDVTGIATFRNPIGLSTITSNRLTVNGNLYVTGISTFADTIVVGSATSTNVPAQKLQVTGDTYISGNVAVGTTNPLAVIDIRNINGIGVTSRQTASTSTVGIHTLSATTFRSAKYQVQVSFGSTHQMIELGAVHDGSTAYVSQFNEVTTGVQLAAFSVDISGSNLVLSATPTYSGITTFKIVHSAITV